MTDLFNILVIHYENIYKHMFDENSKYYMNFIKNCYKKYNIKIFKLYNNFQSSYSKYLEYNGQFCPIIYCNISSIIEVINISEEYVTCSIFKQGFFIKFCIIESFHNLYTLDLSKPYEFEKID